MNNFTIYNISYKARVLIMCGRVLKCSVTYVIFLLQFVAVDRMTAGNAKQDNEEHFHVDYISFPWVHDCYLASSTYQGT